MSYLDTETFIYSTLSTDANLLALIGDSDHISTGYPENFEKITVWPYIIFREEGQDDREFADNKPTASGSSYVIDIYVKEGDTYPIAKVVHDIFMNIYWTCEYSSDVPDPDIMVRHRVMRFKRLLFAGDLL